METRAEIEMTRIKKNNDKQEGRSNLTIDSAPRDYWDSTAKSVSDTTDLAAIADTLHRLTQFAEEIESICGTNGDRIFGPELKPVSDDVREAPDTPSGTARQVHMRLEQLEARIEKAAYQARRFNSL